MDTGTIQHWREASRDAGVASAIDRVYTMIADQIEARRPRCEASGRCCNFEKHGHRLYVTGLEAALTLGRLATPAPDERAVDAALARGDCPFLAGRLCSVHTIKPLGCRVYFCDPTASQWQIDLSERAMAMIRTIHERHGIPYVYAEWRSLLLAFAACPST